MPPQKGDRIRQTFRLKEVRTKALEQDRTVHRVYTFVKVDGYHGRITDQHSVIEDLLWSVYSIKLPSLESGSGKSFMGCGAIEVTLDVTTEWAAPNGEFVIFGSPATVTPPPTCVGMDDDTTEPPPEVPKPPEKAPAPSKQIPLPLPSFVDWKSTLKL